MFQYYVVRKCKSALWIVCQKKYHVEKKKVVMCMVPNYDYDMRGGCVLRAGLRRVALDL